MSRDVDFGQIAPRNAVWMLCLGLALASATLLFHITLPPALLLLGCILSTWFAWRPPLPPKVLRALVFVCGIGLVLFTHGTLLGVEAGLSVLAVLISLKILEAHRPRDFHVLVLLGFFLCLTLLFFFQQLYVMLYVLLVLLVLFAALVMSGAGPDLRRRRALGVAARLMLQSVPLMVLLFLLFPRDLLRVRFSMINSQSGQTGMSDHMLPGSVASLASSDAPAFRAEFPGGEIPRARDLYWRGNVLWRCFGLSWMPGRSPQELSGSPEAGGPTVLQRIKMEPHGGHWVFALDRPITTPPDTSFTPGGSLRSRRIENRASRYEVTSRPLNTEQELSPRLHRQLLLVAPEVITPRLQALTTQMQTGTDQERMQAVLNFFRNDNFVYTMQPGLYGADGLDDFLFNRRRGFCEHYAGAYATLMRLVGVPARVVTGYHGGEFNPHGGYVIVRQAHAHAWCEVFIAGKGWQRVDVVEIIAPGRISSGSSSFNQPGGVENVEDTGGVGVVRTSRLGRLWEDTRLVWDNLQFQWDAGVMDFGSETQNSLFNLAGFTRPDSGMLLLWCALGVALPIVIAGAFMHFRRRTPKDPLVAVFGDFCSKAARAGLMKHPGEGPQDFAQRLEVRFPNGKDNIRHITDLYIRMRYGPKTREHDPQELRKAVSNLRFE